MYNGRPAGQFAEFLVPSLRMISQNIQSEPELDLNLGRNPYACVLWISWKHDLGFCFQQNMIKSKL